MKVCNVCNIQKSESEFYKGHAKCKACYILKVKAHREEKADYYREYDNNRANLPHRVAAREAYAQTEAGRIAGKKAKEKWINENVIKRSANIIIRKVTPGMKRYRLTAIKPLEDRPTIWHFDCDCGGKIILPRNKFLQKDGQARSCGCIRREARAKVEVKVKKVVINKPNAFFLGLPVFL